VARHNERPGGRIELIGAFEHFGQDRYDHFFKTANHLLPDNGVMLLHTITSLTMKQALERGVPLTFELARFLKFLMTDIFPGGQIPTIEMVQEHSTDAGFNVTRIQSLQPHYARTLDSWAEALESHKDEAIALQSEEVYDRYMRYLTGCANGFRAGNSDVNQFTLEK